MDLSNGREVSINSVLSVTVRSQWSDGELSDHKFLSTHSGCWSNSYIVPNEYIASL
jgi:hypothetical protein